jgi:hypothetical protein
MIRCCMVFACVQIIFVMAEWSGITHTQRLFLVLFNVIMLDVLLRNRAQVERNGKEKTLTTMEHLSPICVHSAFLCREVQRSCFFRLLCETFRAENIGRKNKAAEFHVHPAS